MRESGNLGSFCRILASLIDLVDKALVIIDRVQSVLL